MKKTKPFVLILLVIMLYSCAQIFNGAVLPNQCKKCDLLDAYTSEILFSLEGCGSQNTDLYGKCVDKAWELSRDGNLCAFNIECHTWKKDKD